MTKIRYLLAILLFCSTAAIAAPASEAAIKQLFAVTHAQNLLDGTRSQLRGFMDKASQQALQGTTPTVSQERALTKMKARMLALIDGELAWEKLEPMYLRLYAATFSEEEVQGMLAFYATPAGQALIKKMPTLMRQTMVDIQKVMADLMPRMQKIQQEFAAEMKQGGAD